MDDRRSKELHEINADDGLSEPSSLSGPESSSIPSSSLSILPSAYKKILVPVPHDNTEMSDKALGHAIYLANATGFEDISDTTFVGYNSSSDGTKIGEDSNKTKGRR